MRSTEFERRRRELAKMIGKGGIAILPAAIEKQRNGDVNYHYRPDSDFYYLTGFNEPDAVAVLVPGRAQAEYILFVRDRDPARVDLFGPEALRYGGSIVATAPVAHHDVEARTFGERPERRDPVPIKARLFDDGSDPHCPDRAPGWN